MQINQVYLRLFFFFVIALNINIAHGLPTLPPGAAEQIDPGRIGESLNQQLKPLQLLPKTKVKPKKNKSPLADKQSEKVIFVLHGVVIEGNTVFKPEDLAKIYQHKLSATVTITDMEDIAQAITVYYRNAGYILTQAIVPQQTVDPKGIVKIKIIEGYINKISIQGKEKISSATIKLLENYGEHITTQRPLNIKTLERFALLANDVPGATIKTAIEPSATASGASDMVFIASQDSINWYAGANNFNSELLGREQMIGGAYVNGILSGSQTGIRGVMSCHTERLKYFTVSHKQQINSYGLGMDAKVSKTKTNPNYDSLSLHNLSTPGQAFIANLNSTYPIIRAREKNLILGGGFNYMNSYSTFNKTNIFYDATRSINVSIQYSFIDKLASNNNIDLSASQGLNILAARTAPPSVAGGKTKFSKINFSANRYQAFAKQNIFILLWVKAQYAFTKLLSSEKFGFGGAPFGYGYDPSAITGDRGYALKLELQYSYAFKKLSRPRIQFFGFSDNATVWNINKTVQSRRQNATSAGAGIRMTAIKNLYMEFITAKPFSKLATSNNSNNLRFLFNISYNGGVIGRG